MILAAKQRRNEISLYASLTTVFVFLLIAVMLHRNNRQKKKAYALLRKQKAETDKQKVKLENTLAELKSTQAQLIQSERNAAFSKLEQAMLKERLRISRELHDDIGGTLSGITMYSHFATKQIDAAQTSEVKKSLSIMQESADEMVNKLNDIVWLINPGQDSIQKLLERLEEYATEMAMLKNMELKVSIPCDLTEISLPVEIRRNIYLVCKEAVNNAVKYSNASFLELTVEEAGENLEFSVCDNGKGFDPVVVREKWTGKYEETC
jgi:signal transduction histidine kinase